MSKQVNLVNGQMFLLTKFDTQLTYIWMKDEKCPIGVDRLEI